MIASNQHLTSFDEDHDDFINPGIFARQLADFLELGLRAHGYSIKFRCAEDWGYWQEIEHDRGYTLAVGCMNVDEPNDGTLEHCVFVRPDSSPIRPAKHWFRKTDVQADVERLVAAVGEILGSENRIADVELNETRQ